MWIEQLELANFKAYQDQTFKFLKPQSGRNLVLIGGLNGHGKTTLLEALYLCFYGEDAVSHLSRAGLKENAYVRFLQAALHGKPRERHDHAMRVSIRIMVRDDYGYRITRNWYFDPRGGYQDQDVRLYEVRDGIEYPLDAEVQLPSVLQQHVVPAHLAPFFFFDGEEVKKLADRDQKGWIKQGMESLLGVVLVRNLRERLFQYQNNRRQGASAKDKEEIERMFAQIQRKMDKSQEVLTDLVACKQRIATLNARQEKLHEQLILLGAGDGNLKSIEDIVREQGDLRQKVELCEKNLAQLLGDRLPLHLIHPDLSDSLRQRMDAERLLIEWDDRKHRLDPDRVRFTQHFFRAQPVSHIVDHERSALQQAIDEAWESLYWPRPEGCADVLLHGYLEPRQRQRLAESQAAIAVGAAEIRALIEERNRVRRRSKELEIQRLQLQGVDEDGTLRTVTDELKAVQQELSELSRNQGDLERQKTALDAEINQLNTEYQRENQRYLRSEPAQSVARKAERVRAMIDELLPSLFQLKIDRLSACVSKRFRDMAHRDWIDRIEIDTDGSAKLLGQDGNELRFDPSAGENQIFATALFAGLADVSGYHVPLVVDTPLARLDSRHRENLLNYWRSDPERQVILLSQDEEIDASLAVMLEEFVSDTWLLESKPIGGGLYRTSAREGYFGGDA